MAGGIRAARADTHPIMDTPTPTAITCHSDVSNGPPVLQRFKMPFAPVPANELTRLKALRDLMLLDTPDEPLFDLLALQDGTLHYVNPAYAAHFCERPIWP